MLFSWSDIEDRDRDIFRTTIVFLQNRLDDWATIEWALKLERTRRIERLAVRSLIGDLHKNDLPKLYVNAWRLIEESWSTDSTSDYDALAYNIEERLRSGDRSGGVISLIAEAVSPGLRVYPVSHSEIGNNVNKRINNISDIMYCRIISGGLIDVKILNYESFKNIEFLLSLANALEGEVARGLDIARRIGWTEERSFVGLGFLNRVYYVPRMPGESRIGDPDALNYGIAPAVKILHAVVEKIRLIEPAVANLYAERWWLNRSPVHIRLWAAISRFNDLAMADRIGSRLLELEWREFWDINRFPEVAELRALQFHAFNPKIQGSIFKRIKTGPPRKFFLREADVATVNRSRLYWAVRELKRIERADGTLHKKAKDWLDVHILQFSDLQDVPIDEGFPVGATVGVVPTNPDDRYDLLSGVTRLSALESALSTDRRHWNDDPAKRALDWLQQSGKVLSILADLKDAGGVAGEFICLWKHFCVAHTPVADNTGNESRRDIPGEAGDVLRLLSEMPESTLLAAIEGISIWLGAWKSQVASAPLGVPVWLRVWPVAVEATDNAGFSVVARAADGREESLDPDEYDSPVSRLFDVFWASRPQLAEGVCAFGTGSVHQKMRDVMIESLGRSEAIIRRKFLEKLPYFLAADPDWAERYLLLPLKRKDGESIAYWRAIAVQTHFTDVLERIGDEMVTRATDRRLGRETQCSLVFSLVNEALRAFYHEREPAVSFPRIQQMLRALDDEVRACAAGTLPRFVRDRSERRSGSEIVPMPAMLFRVAIMPFLREVWPQEYSLVTPSVSRALSRLPVASGEAFADSVNVIERFLVPFECWSMSKFGFPYNSADGSDFSVVDTQPKAEALLNLLDRTIGTSEGAVIPYDLAAALEHIRSIAPALAASPVFRRLYTAARR